MATFPCGCTTWRSSGYRFCAKRWIEPCPKTLEKFVWKTFCPASRKALRNVVAINTKGSSSVRAKYTSDTRLPVCCTDLGMEECMRLCTKCCSLPAANSNAEPNAWHCPGHLERVSKICVATKGVECVESRGGTGNVDVNVVAQFEKAVVLWPVDHQKRYFRRKGDKGLKGKEIWWSF
jgi:hypothetical protein